jgi:glycosyltransferase involved in cell wall biosynthesis
MPARLRVAICADFVEERWPSMDRVATMLHDTLRDHHGDQFDVTCVRPAFARVATRLPVAAASRVAFNADRYLNRFWRYPAHAAALVHQYDLFHVVDHSYAHLVHALPAARTIVTCHDLDAFRSIVAPGDEPRSAPFRRVTRRILTGLQRAACVTCDATPIRDELAARALVPPQRLVVAPLGVDHAFFARSDPEAERAAMSVAPASSNDIELLHVGGAAPRKRIDVLLQACARVARELPQVRLTRVGDPFTAEQQRMVRELAIEDRVTAVSRVDERTLAALYRRAVLVLQPSEREGFGLPVIEALASGTPIVASDIAVLREVGGTAAEYCAVGDVEGWARTVVALLNERRVAVERWTVRREAGRRQARRFTWEHFGSTIAEIYRAVSASNGLIAATDTARAAPFVQVAGHP